MIGFVIAGFIVCLGAVIHSTTSLFTQHWMLWEFDVFLDDTSSRHHGKGVLLTDVIFGLFRICITAESHILNGRSTTNCTALSYDRPTFSSETTNGILTFTSPLASHLKVVHAFTILGLVCTGLGGIVLILFCFLRVRHDSSPRRLLYAASVLNGLGAIGSLIGAVVFATLVYGDLKQQVDSANSVIQRLNRGSFRAETKELALNWSFYLCIGSVVWGVLSAILVAVGAKQLPDPGPTQPGLRARAPRVFYNPNQSVVTMQAPPTGHGRGQAPSRAPYHIGSQGQAPSRAPYYIGNQRQQQMTGLRQNYYVGAQMTAAPPVYQEKAPFPATEQPDTPSNYDTASGGQNVAASPPACHEKGKIPSDDYQGPSSHYSTASDGQSMSSNPSVYQEKVQPPGTYPS